MVRTIAVSEVVSRTVDFFGMSGQQVFSLSSLRDQVDYAGLTGLVKQYAPSRLREIGDAWFQRAVSAGVTGLETAAIRSQTFNRIVTNGKTLGVLDFARKDPFSSAVVILISILGIVSSIKGIMNFFNKSSPSAPKQDKSNSIGAGAPVPAPAPAPSAAPIPALVPKPEQEVPRSASGMSEGNDLRLPAYSQTGSRDVAMGSSSKKSKNRNKGQGDAAIPPSTAGQGMAASPAPSPAMAPAASGSGLISTEDDSGMIASAKARTENRSFSPSQISSAGNGDSSVVRGSSPSSAAGGGKLPSGNNSDDD